MKTYTLKPTLDKDLFRVVDMEGDWTHYYHSPSKTYLRSVTYILDMGYAKGKRFNEYLLSKTKEEARKIFETAGERGNRIHQFIARIFDEKGKVDRTTKVVAEDGVTGVALSNSEWRAVLSWERFWNSHGCVRIAHEYPVYNLKSGYAGTLDSLLRMTKACGVRSCKCDKLIGKIGLFDWKSGGGIYESFAAQNAAYSYGDNLYKVLGDSKVDYTAVLRIGTGHVTTGGYEFKPSDRAQFAIDILGFLAAKTIHDTEYKPFDQDKEIYNVPDVIKVVIKTENLLKKKTKKKVVKKGKVKK